MKNAGVMPLGVAEQFSINERGGALYKTMCDSRLLITRPFRTICKQPGLTRITKAVHLWLLLPQDTPHDIKNKKTMAYKTDIYRKMDLDAAYRQKHENATTTSTCIEIVTLFR